MQIPKPPGAIGGNPLRELDMDKVCFGAEFNVIKRGGILPMLWQRH